MTKAQKKLLTELKEMDEQGTWTIANFPAIGGWTQKEQDLARAVHASDMHWKTLGSLRADGLVRHVGDGFYTITDKGIAAIS